MGLFSEKVSATVEGYSIVAKLTVNPLFLTIKTNLWIDGVLTDSRTQQTMPAGCLVRGDISIRGEKMAVEVFATGSTMSTRLAIKLAGKEIANSGSK